ncbi:MAG: hypothetical protein HKN16_03530 [Saprospiraceae bacterium]|nr:hypothetical protein [Saprospiraceae bacterium]
MILKEVQSHSAIRESTNFDSVHSVGILFDATGLDDRKAILHYAESLKKQDKKVKLLGYLNEKENQPNYTFDHFCNTELSWIGKNKSEKVEQFVRTDFDLLFCLSDAQSLVDIAARSIAKLRVGPSIQNTLAFDLMIETNSTNQRNFLDQVEFFTKKMNTQ